MQIIYSLWFQVFQSNINNFKTGITTLCQSESESNGNEWVFYTPQISHTLASPSGAV